MTLSEQSIIRSVFIRVEAPPRIEIQRENIIRRGEEVVASSLLPLERFDPAQLTDSDRDVIEVALGEVATGAVAQSVQAEQQAQQALAAQDIAEEALALEQSAHQSTTERLEDLQGEFDQANRQIQGMTQQLQALTQQLQALTQIAEGQQQLIDLLGHPEEAVRQNAYENFAVMRAKAQ
ncbi:hypothetical protein [Deinococcus alpinitundrae]|uniref:hypothetical protein n=1 Tax=Deinococcus alpinitundrae TaxID=468913 RepID=UPI001379D3D3|nr:hypothetical protein [Deinococcus alpinitundrae]